jgi:hypothetical protein
MPCIRVRIKAAIALEILLANKNGQTALKERVKKVDTPLSF